MLFLIGFSVVLLGAIVFVASWGWLLSPADEEEPRHG